MKKSNLTKEIKNLYQNEIMEELGINDLTDELICSLMDGAANRIKELEKAVLDNITQFGELQTALEKIEELKEREDGLNHALKLADIRIEELEHQNFELAETMRAVSKRQQWISVEDRLPDKVGTYLCHWDNGDIDSFKFRQCDLDDYKDVPKDYEWGAFGLGGFVRVTHWMELPEPPNGDV